VSGLKPVNSDKFFEFLLKAKYQTTDLASFTPEDFIKATVGPDSEREKGKAIGKNVYTHFVGGRLGMIIDGTGSDSTKIKKQAEELQQVFGYDVAMVFVNTSLEKAIDRNNNRDRKLPKQIVLDSWNDAQKAKEAHKQFFGSTFFEIMNDTDSAPGQPINIDKEVEKKVQGFIRRPVQNPVGKDWIQKALAAKDNVHEAQVNSQYQIHCDMDGVLCDFVKQWMKYHKGVRPDDLRHRIGKPEFDVILDSMDRKFWSTMEWMPGMQRVWNVISKYGATILSSPADGEDSPNGKLDWVKKHIPGTEVVFRKSQKKQEFSGPNKILIDDLKRNIDQWRDKGGIAIHHISVEKTLKELSDLGIK